MNTKNNKELLIMYAGYSFKMAFVLAFFVTVGYFIDKHFFHQNPVAIITLPLIAIIVSIAKTIIDTKK
jgi:predicted Kef-type K+ transport protein